MGLTSKRRVAIEIRKQSALKLRLQGGSFQDIAEALRKSLDSDDPVPGVTLKYARQNAHADVKHALQEYLAENKSLAELEITQQLEQLSELWNKFYPIAAERGDVQAFDRCMTILKRRASLLGVEPSDKMILAGSQDAPFVINVIERNTKNDCNAVERDS